jgi:mRNA interferase RelE/StbE
LTKSFAAKWKLQLSERANKDLEKLSQTTKERIIQYFEKTLLNQDNPKMKGKALSGHLVGQWCYRIGTYRVLTKIQDEKMIILAISLGHRKEIYKKR